MEPAMQSSTWMGPAHLRVGDFLLWLLPAARVYLRVLPGYEGFAASLPAFEDAIGARWNDLATGRVEAREVEGAVREYYADNF